MRAFWCFISVLLLTVAMAMVWGPGATARGGSVPLAPPPGTLAVSLHASLPLHITGPKVAPSDAQCRAQIGVPCYSPQEIRQAYGLTPLLNKGYTGAGQTIVIIDSYGSPTLEADLAVFDADFGLPAPPSLKVLAPLGTVPFDPSNNDMLGWAEETSLDVQWAHAMAPGAGIVVMTSPVSETEGVQGLPEFLQLEQYAVNHHLGKIVSQSWAATEETLLTTSGRAVMAQFNAFYRQSTLRGVTFLGSTGDSGTANVAVDGSTYPYPTVNFPAISPWVTAVGGTSLYASTTGAYQSETVWNDGIGSATGGGVSKATAEPFYQRLLPRQDQRILAGQRAVPDISFNADPNTGVLVHLGFLGAGNNGYYIFGGTSEGSPAWAGVVADLNQRAGFALGFLNPTLYALGAAKLIYPAVLHDVTVGNNAQPPIAGFSAGAGWDAATGWGTPKLSGFADSFIRQAARSASSGLNGR
ncbi:protease [Arthrobacter livingstonensis]|uniref:Protease n=1 Tax=Arthrobacter livingstonensis TaxID=670078 RepID=A0A2V5L7M3_9MICC|nr:protease [Arthrobacter livingstonensis]